VLIKKFELNNILKIKHWRNKMPGNSNPMISKGGRKPGAGRPKGSKNINSMASVRKLEELGFDPIEMMVRKYNDIQEKLNYLEGIGKHTSGAYAQMTATQGTLINNLMAYGYKKIPDKIEQEFSERKPISIVLTDNKKENNDE
jgi:hypothetical protein